MVAVVVVVVVAAVVAVGIGVAGVLHEVGVVGVVVME